MYVKENEDGSIEVEWTHLGDGCYAQWQGHQVLLRANSHHPKRHTSSFSRHEGDDPHMPSILEDGCTDEVTLPYPAMLQDYIEQCVTEAARIRTEQGLRVPAPNEVGSSE